jgi:hypothetical protein
MTPYPDTTAGAALAQPRVWQTMTFWRWLALCLVSAFLLSTIKLGQAWDGDAELFILGALNILNGEDYGATNYIVNHDHAIHPAAYPPGLPLLMAPFIGLFGIDYLIIKFGLTACYIGVLAVVSRMATPFMSERFIVLLILGLGLNPVVWHLKDVVYSEFPFMLFAYLGLFAFDRLDQATAQGAARARVWMLTLACAAAIALAYEVRAIGMVLFAAVAVMSVWRFKRMGLLGLAVLALALMFNTAISRMFPADLSTYTSYYDVASLDGLDQIARAVLTSAGIYIRALGELVAGGGEWSWLQAGIAAAVLSLSAIGVVRSAVRRLSIFEVFLCAYLGALLVYPITEEPVRYAQPILPLVFLYFLHAVAHVPLRIRLDVLKPVAVGIALALLYLPQFVAPDYGDGVSVDGPEAIELYTQIRSQVPADAVILCSKPTVIALYGQRHATNPPRSPTREDFRRHVKQTEATWMVELMTPLYDELSVLAPELDDDLEAVFENRLFRLYRIRSEAFARLGDGPDLL